MRLPAGRVGREWRLRSAELQTVKKNIVYAWHSPPYLHALFSLINTGAQTGEQLICTTPNPYFTDALGTLLKNPRRARLLFCI
jgi:hypothetical protein